MHQMLLMFSLPVSELLGDVQMFQVVVYGPLILLQKSVGVSEAVTGLSLHHLVPQLSGQLQSFPIGRKTEGSNKENAEDAVSHA